VWTHVTVTRDVSAKEFRWFKNGSLSETDPYTNNPGGGANCYYSLGKRSGGTGSASVHLAEVGLWDRELSDDEIAALGAGLSPDHFPNSIVSYVSFRDNSTYCKYTGAPDTTYGSGGVESDHPEGVVYPAMPRIGIKAPAAVGARPQGPLSHPLSGPFGGPL